jgi:hypothetical protein
MSLGRKCDNCHRMIEASDSSDKPLDCLVLFNGDIDYEYEDLCPRCQERLRRFLADEFPNIGETHVKAAPKRDMPLNGMGSARMVVPPVTEVLTAGEQGSHDENESSAIQEKPGKAPAAYTPFSGVDDESLADSVVNRWPLPAVKHVGGN